MSRHDVEIGEKAWLEAFNGGDANGVAAEYTANARMLAPGLEIIEGRQAITPFIQGFIDTGATLEFDLVEVHEAPDVCTAVGRYRMTVPDADDDHGKYIEVWTRQGDGSWLIQDDIFNSSVPVPES